MPRNRKKDFDAASLNKEEYIRSNYLVKEDDKNNYAVRRNRMIITFMLCFLLISSAALFYWTYFMKPQNEVQIQATPIITITPSPTLYQQSLYTSAPTPKPTLEKYTEYAKIYPEIVGWISIDNIKVDYPVVKSSNPVDPFKYLDLGPDEKPSDGGAIFLDIRNSIDATDKHIIIYGHNMRDNSMFGQLDKYLSRSFFFNHLIIRYDTLYQELEWEVFNVFITNTNFYYIQTHFESDQEFVDLMNLCVYKSYYNDNKTVITEKDRVLTLSTCTNEIDDGRLVVQARLITPLEGEDIADTPSN